MAIKTTIPEGYTIEQIAELLDKKNIIEREVFITAAQNYSSDRDLLKHRSDGSLEGYLFPDTYNISRGISAENIIEKMLSNFVTRVEPVILTPSSRFNIHQIISNFFNFFH